MEDVFPQRNASDKLHRDIKASFPFAVSMEFDDVRTIASFENKKSTKRFKVEMDGKSFILHYDGNEVTA